MARHYQFTITGVLEAEDEDDARCELDELMGEVRGYLESELSEEIVSQIRADIVVMPRAYTEGLGIDTEPEPTHDNAGYHGFEQGGATHPWDQGAFFFPEDHPLGPLEREAYREARTKEGTRRAWADRSRMLTEGEQDDE